MILQKITGVAIMYNGKMHTLPAPNRHHHIIHSIDRMDSPHTEGFVLEDGTFRGRREAMSLAENNGQLNRKPGAEFYQGPELFSEDLW